MRRTLDRNNEYDPVSKTLQRVNDAAREKRVQFIVQRAWEEYGKVESSFDPKDPLGLLSGKKH